MSNHLNNNTSRLHQFQAHVTLQLEKSGGKIVMTGAPAATYHEAVENLQRAHEEYDEVPGWGGPG